MRVNEDFEVTGFEDFKNYLLNLPFSNERGFVVYSGILEKRTLYKNTIFTALKKVKNKTVLKVKGKDFLLTEEKEVTQEELTLFLKEIVEVLKTKVSYLKNNYFNSSFENIVSSLINKNNEVENNQQIWIALNALKNISLKILEEVDLELHKNCFIFFDKEAQDLILNQDKTIEIFLNSLKDLLIETRFSTVLFNPCNTSFNLFKESENVKLVSLKEKGDISIEEIQETGKEIKEIVSDTIEYEKKTKQLLEGLVYQNQDLKQKYLSTPFYNATITDFLVFSDKEARFRKGFETNEKEVVVPTFAFLIEGYDFELYRKIVEVVQKNNKSIVLLQDKTRKNQGDGLFTENYFNSEVSNEVAKARTHSEKIIALQNLRTKITEELKLKVEKYLLKEIKFNTVKLSLSNDIFNDKIYRFQGFNRNVNEFLLRKINEYIEDREFNEEKAIHFVSLVLQLKQNIIEYIDGLNPSSYIPTIIVFLQERTILEKDNILMLGFLRTLGFDVVILSPAALSGVTQEDFDFNANRLEQTKYDLNADEIIRALLLETKRKNMTWFDKVKALFK
jgi:hypothetical protein